MTGTSDRIIGASRSARPGPVVVAVAGLHGNEQAGIPACRKVFEALVREDLDLSGRFVALTGNLTALSLGRRFADEDLNRIWQPFRIAEAESGTVRRTAEAGEQQALLREVRRIIETASGEICFLDLHTTSAPGAPFSILSDTRENRRIAAGLPGSMVLGLDTHLDGTFLNFINRLGFAAVGFEGGQHEDPTSVDAHELAIWVTLVEMGCLHALPAARARALIQSLGPLVRDSPPVVEIVYRHPVAPGDGFLMEAGFRNLQRVEQGAVLARSLHGPIRATADSRILMPLYQSQGEDGFFLACEPGADR